VDFFADDFFFAVDLDAVFFTLLLDLAGALLLDVVFLEVLEWLDDLVVCASASRLGTIIVPASKAPATTAIEPLNQVRNLNSLSTRSLFPSTIYSKLRESLSGRSRRWRNQHRYAIVTNPSRFRHLHLLRSKQISTQRRDLPARPRCSPLRLHLL